MGDAEATRERILRAATDEFAARGIAGARVDRIAASAKANKAQMYAYFGSKEDLFEVVFQAHKNAVVDAVPLTPDDLPGYAQRLYDDAVAHPAMVRLAMWQRLERAPEGDLALGDDGYDVVKRDAVVAAQRDGTVDPAMDPDDVVSLVIAMALAWSAVSITLTARPEDGDAVHERRRAALGAAVGRAFGA
jgi:AcrR family transcriptional regulator